MEALAQASSKWFESAFGEAPQVLSWAPGRLEVLGNHTDYNLGEVLGVTVNRGVVVGVRRRTDRRITMQSAAPGHRTVAFQIGSAIIPRDEKAEFWAHYPMGVWKVMREEGFSLDSGFDLGVFSNLPEGAGMSSSAALEIGTALALAELHGVVFADRDQLVRIGQRAENEFVGMPCGLLDQSVVVYGDTDRMVWVDCKSGSKRALEMPPGIFIHVFNTAEKHELVDSLYTERHRECMEATERLKGEFPEITGLADLSVDALEQGSSVLSPLLLKRARHVVEENARVQAACALLEEPSCDVEALGSLLWASHASSRLQFENSTEHLDFLVERLHRCSGVLGARLTGGGFGGAVLALTTSAFSEAQAAAVASDYAGQFGAEPAVFVVGTGEGARVL